ncbi:MAG: hypothetical protein RL757_579, partial [Bacteroidota bacterium]
MNFERLYWGGAIFPKKNLFLHTFMTPLGLAKDLM